EPRPHPFAMPQVAARVVRMADVQLAEHLAQEILEVVTRRDARGQRTILLPHAVPIDAVHLAVVEEIAVETPGLVQHLRPLVARRDAERYSREIDLRILRVIVFGS